MKALITGIRGFVGGHLAKYLLDRNFEVAGLDSDDKDFDLDIDPEKIPIFKGDLRDEALVANALSQFKPDYVFHLAAQSSVRISFENPLETFSVNLMGTLVLLESISKLDFPVKTLVISSSEVYGRLKPDECPVAEDHPMRPINPYAVSKASVDLLARQYYAAYQMPVYIARAFSHSGPGQKTVAVLSDWAFQLSRIELNLAPPSLKVGNMKVQRDYTDVGDVVRAYFDIIEKGRPGTPYNVCSGQGYSLSQLLEKFILLIKTKIEVISDKSRQRPIDIPILIGSYERLKTDTGWEPEIPIERTLEALLSYWNAHLVEEL